MAGEIFIARQDTLEAVQQTVNEIDTNVDTVNTTTTNTKAETANIKTDTDGLKLSTDSIKQIADTILERIGLTTDKGGANTGTVLGKLNGLFSSGSGGIKRVQRGIVTSKEYSGQDPELNNEKYIFVNLTNPINPEKSFLNLYSVNGYWRENTTYSGAYTYGVCGRIYSSTKLIIYANRETSDTYKIDSLCWEVIEFN